MTPAEVFVLWHVLERGDGDEDIQFVGVYSTRERAEAVRDRGERLPGFQAAVEGFVIQHVALDGDPWGGGSVTGTPDPPAAGSNGSGGRAGPALVDLMGPITPGNVLPETGWGQPVGREMPPWEGESG